MLHKIKPHYQAVIVLIIWGAVVFASNVLRFDAFGIEEAAARALLLVWSVVDRVINPIFMLGIPDLRALIFIPVAMHEPGNITAAKIYTLLLTFLALLMLYRWSRKYSGDEAALLATGLSLIAPLTLLQIDTLAAGPFILLGFAVGHYMDQAYRRAQRPLGGWFFLQLLLVIVLLSIHPVALAYPLALTYHWLREPLDARHQRHLFIGMGVAIIFTLLISNGWDTIHWLQNPLLESAVILAGTVNDSTLHWSLGLLLLTLVITLVGFNRKRLWDDLLSRMLVIASVIGLACADTTWAFVVMMLLLYSGIASLIRLNKQLGGHSFAGQRGLTMVIIFIIATIFMQGDKAQHQRVSGNLLAADDLLIQSLVLELENNDDDNILIMSQWPGKTMLASRLPVIPLPPDYPDPEALLKNIRGTTHIIFDPSQAENASLRENLARLSSIAETILLDEGGVIIRIETTTTANTTTNAIH